MGNETPVGPPASAGKRAFDNALSAVIKFDIHNT